MQSCLSEGAGEPGIDGSGVQLGRQHYRAAGGRLWAVHLLWPDGHEGHEESGELLHLQPRLCPYLSCCAVLMLLLMDP